MASTVRIPKNPLQRSSNSCYHVISLGRMQVGFWFVGVSVLCFGSNFLPVKYFPTGDGMFFQWLMCVGIWCVGLLTQLVVPYTLVDFLFQMISLTSCPISLSSNGLSMRSTRIFTAWILFRLKHLVQQRRSSLWQCSVVLFGALETWWESFFSWITFGGRSILSSLHEALRSYNSMHRDGSWNAHLGRSLSLCWLGKRVKYWCFDFHAKILFYIWILEEFLPILSGFAKTKSPTQKWILLEQWFASSVSRYFFSSRLKTLGNHRLLSVSFASTREEPCNWHIYWLNPCRKNKTKTSHTLILWMIVIITWKVSSMAPKTWNNEPGRMI